MQLLFKVVSKYKQALHGLPCFVCGGKANGNLAFRKNALKMALRFMPGNFIRHFLLRDNPKPAFKRLLQKLNEQ